MIIFASSKYSVGRREKLRSKGGRDGKEKYFYLKYVLKIKQDFPKN